MAKQTGIPYAVDRDFFKHDTPEAFYVAGFIAADGCLTHKGTMLNITLKQTDRPHLEKIRAVMKSEHPISERLNKDSKRDPRYMDTIGCMLRITSKDIAADLNTRFNIFPRKSLSMKFPKRIFDHQLVHYFLLGYFDGDGSIGFDYTGRWRKTPSARVHIRGTIDFLQHFHRLMIKNTDANIKEDKKISTDSNIGSLQYTGNRSVQAIMDYLYADPTLYLIRKYERYQQLLIFNAATDAKMTS